MSPKVIPDRGSVSRAEAWKCVREQSLGDGGTLKQAVTGPLYILPANLKNVCPSSGLSQMTSKPTVGTLPSWPEGVRLLSFIKSGVVVLWVWELWPG